MDVDTFTKVLGAVTGFVSAVAWPCAVLIVIYRFAGPLRNLIANLTEFSVSGAGIDISGKKAAVAAAVGAAIASKEINGDGAKDSEGPDARIASNAAQRSVTRENIRRAEGSRVLWVDDKPNGNLYERQSLEALGISITTAISTEMALQEIERQTFDLVITDLNRPEGERAGYDLLSKIRDRGLRVPVIFYSGYRSTKFQAEALNLGAFGFTNRPDELLSMVLTALRSTSSTH